MKTGMTQHDQKLIKSVYEKMYVHEADRQTAIIFVSARNNITVKYMDDLFRTYEKNKAVV